MIREIFNVEDEKLLDVLKTRSAKKPEIIKCMLFLYFMRIITSLKFAFAHTLLLFLLFVIFITFLRGFSITLCFVYLISHFLLYEFYIKKEHEKSFKSYHELTLLAIEILKNRLATKSFE
jgi:hypothetical protein